MIRRLDGLEKDNSGLRPRRSALRQRGNARGRHRRARFGCTRRRAFAVVALLRVRRRRGRARRGRALRRELDCVERDRAVLRRRACGSCATGSVSRARSRPPHAAYVLVEAAAEHRSDRCARPGGRALRRRRRRRGRDRRRRVPRALALPRRPSRGDQPGGRAAQARRGAAGRPARRSSSARSRRVWPRSRRRASVWMFGHAGDGNVHVNVTGVALDDDRADRGGVRARRRVARLDQRRARDRYAPSAVPASGAQPGRDRDLSRDQARPRSARHPESARVAAGRRRARLTQRARICVPERASCAAAVLFSMML